MLGRVVLWLLLIAALGCGRGVAPVRVPSLPPPDPHGLTVTLVWDAPVDLDLYVTDPTWATVYYARRAGHLDVDARCVDGRPSARAERARWTDPLPGRYRIGVDFPEACAGAVDQVPFRLIVDRAGSRQDVTGTTRLGVRQPVTLEFTMP
jgi:hypothetical protein